MQADDSCDAAPFDLRLHGLVARATSEADQRAHTFAQQILRAVGDECEIEARESTYPVLLNNRSVTRARLRHGDNVTIGRTSFVFQQRKS